LLKKLECTAVLFYLLTAHYKIVVAAADEEDDDEHVGDISAIFRTF